MSQTGGSYRLLSHPTQGEAVNLPDIGTSPSTSRGPRSPLDPTPPPPSPSYGRPAHKRFFNVVDTIAIILSLVCLGVTIGAISPSLRYAAELQYTGQIIVLGFALGIMNQCLQRVTPPLFLLLETRFGSSTIQNYDGILRWSPLADKFGLLWRLALTLLLILPLVLGIAYKRYTGGIGVVDVSGNGTLYTPTFPNGLSNVGDLTALANVTAPFMVATANDSVPVDFETTKAYGYNLLVLNNNSAAAVDAPNQLFVRELQHRLGSGIRYSLTATVRGTVATFNDSVESHRNDDSFWDNYLGLVGMQSVPLPGSIDRVQVGLLHLNSASCDSPQCYNSSWAFLGVFTLPESTSNSSVATALFKQTALGFDVTRRTCTVTWEITSNSMKLVSGDCDPDPLDSVHQYFQNCQMFFTAAYYLPLAGDCIADFSTSRIQSHWRIPTYATITAALFWSKIAGMGGYLAMQVGGPIEMYWTSYLGPVADSDLWQYNNMIAEAEARDGTWKFNETYPLNHTLLKQVSTLKPEAGLYIVLVIQPVLTLAAFLVGLTMYHTPISRGFGMVSTLAGIDKGSVALLSGATFSGRLKVPTRLRIKVTNEELQNDGSSKVEYIVGDKGSHGAVRMRRQYD
ncbi:hypothetical protein LTS15_000151 [Exophiala xenobiotica]|nr:hypothetical protein LTS15_000151 [Exophiala xenobiotica]